MSIDHGVRKVVVAPVGLLQQSIALMGDQYWMFLGITFVGMVVASLVPAGILYGPMACGIYLCYLMRMGGKEVTFETLFKGFDVFVESLIATLVIVVISCIALVPIFILLIGAVVAGAVNDGGSPAMVVLILLAIPVAICLSLLVSALFIFVYPLIVDKDMKALPAITTSCRAVLKNLMGIILLLLLYSVIGILGVLACGIGTIFVTPVMFGATALLYRQIFPVDAKMV